MEKEEVLTEKKTKHVTFRISDSNLKSFNKAIERQKINKSELFRIFMKNLSTL